MQVLIRRPAAFNREYVAIHSLMKMLFFFFRNQTQVCQLPPLTLSSELLDKKLIKQIKAECVSLHTCEKKSPGEKSS